jgi:hypothetical protein
MVAAAATRPEKLGQLFTRWSLRKLADYLACRPGGPVTTGRERLRQILQERGISLQRTRTGKESAGPDRDARLDRIEHVTSACPGRCLAFGQFGPLSIRPCRGACRARREYPVRLRAAYRRTHGVRCFHGCYCVGDDQLRGVTCEREGAVRTLAALTPVRAAPALPAGCRPACAGATPAPATPACWPPSAADEPASAADASSAGAAPGLKLHDRHGGPS